MGIEAGRPSVEVSVHDVILKVYNSELYGKILISREKKDWYYTQLADQRQKFLEDIMREKPFLARELVNRRIDAILLLSPEERPDELVAYEKYLNNQTQELPAIKRTLKF